MAFMNCWEQVLLMQPTCKAHSVAVQDCLRDTKRICLSSEDLMAIHAALASSGPGKSQERSEAFPVRRLLMAVPAPIARLSYPLNVPDAELQAWISAGLLQEVEELSFSAPGGLSDDSLATIARHCPRLRQLGVLSEELSTAKALVLHAETHGALSAEWWNGLEESTLREVQVLKGAVQKQLKVQQVPSWLCGRWSRASLAHPEVRHYDSLGRFVFTRNNVADRYGIVRSCRPSPLGPWWELEHVFFVGMQWQNRLTLVLPEMPFDTTAFPCDREGEAADEALGVAQLFDAGTGSVAGQCTFPIDDNLFVTEWRRQSPKDNVGRLLAWSHQDWVDAVVATCFGPQDAAAESSHSER